MRVNEAASFAEQTTSPAFAVATERAWDEVGEGYLGQKGVAEDILAEAINGHAVNVSSAWDVLRRAAIAALVSPSFAHSPYYTEYFTKMYRLGVKHITTAQTSEETVSDLGLGERGPVYTNGLIMSLQVTVADPIEFFDRAIDTIKVRKAQEAHGIGPENYATTLKYFADKSGETGLKFDDLDGQIAKHVQEQMQRWLKGFSAIAATDAPNVVGMTSIAAAVRSIPAELLPEGFSKAYVRYALENLPYYSRLSVLAALNASGRVSNSEVPEELSAFVDLSVKMLGQFERSNELRTALRAIANLSPSNATHDALSTVMTFAYGLVEPVSDLSGLHDISSSLRKIVTRSITDPSLTLEVKAMAKECTNRAINLYEQKSRDPATSPKDLEEDHKLAIGIATNYSNM